MTTAQALQTSAATSDQTGELQADQIQLIHSQQWLKMLAPREVGGGELNLPDVVQLEETLCAIDGSFGWVVTLCAGAGWFTGFLPTGMAQHIMGTPDVCLAGSGVPTGYAEREGNSWRLNGRWTHASGAQLATHFTCNAQLRENGLPLLDAQGRPRICAFVVSASQVHIEPGSWHSIGLRATTSCAFALHDVRVPHNNAFVIDAASATATGPLYKFPFEALAFVTLAACVLGMARHFMTLAQALVGRHIGPLNGPSISAQMLWSNCDLSLQAARTEFYAQLNHAWRSILQGRVTDDLQDKRLVNSSLTLVRQARESVDQLYPCCGLQAADPRTEINRVWRDLHTASQHALWLR